MYEGSKQPETAHAQYSSTIETQSLGRHVVLDVFRDYRAILHQPRSKESPSAFHGRCGIIRSAEQVRMTTRLGGAW